MLKLQNKIPSALTIGGKIVERVLMNNEVVWGRVQTPLYIQNTYNGSNTVTIQQTLSGSPDSSTYAKHLQFSKNGLNWTTITLSSTAYTITLNKGEKVYFRGNEGVFNYWYTGGKKKAITTISANQTHTVGGNINTLLDYQDPYGLTLPQGAFNSIFENNTKLTSASDITFLPSVDGSLSKYCYLYLFKNCSNLTTVPKSIPAKKQGQDACNGMFAYTAITTAPALPATTLSNGCYYSLFEGCSKLVNAPALPATEMKPNCYRSLFHGCTSLVNAPKLPATTLADGCYRSLFYGCTSLVNAPALPATILGNSCYVDTFHRCSKLVNPPELPATTLKTNCYRALFARCTSLVKAPALPATTLEDGCYRELFYGCTSLVNPPELPAETLKTNCYDSLFYGCSKLNHLTVYANDISATNCTSNWLSGVASKGTFNNYGSARYTANSASGIPTGWVEKKPNEPDYLYIENTYNGINTIYFSTTQSGIHPSSDKYSNQVEYSTDKVNWTTLTFNPSTPQSVIINTGEKLYLRNDTGVFNYYNGNANTYNTNINVSRSNIIGGNINTLLDYKNPDTVPLSHSCFFGLFRDNIATTDVSGLKFGNKTLITGCYREMFTNCSKITNAPELPATTLVESCYKNIFYRCENLNSITVYADDISATNCTTDWLYGVAAKGTFRNLGSATYSRGTSGIPSGWTEVKN